jgi:hypothetical protein
VHKKIISKKEFKGRKSNFKFDTLFQNGIKMKENRMRERIRTEKREVRQKG